LGEAPAPTGALLIPYIHTYVYKMAMSGIADKTRLWDFAGATISRRLKALDRGTTTLET